MYETHETGLWRQHRDDLLREAENGRLVRQLRATRRKRTTPLGDALLRLVLTGTLGDPGAEANR